MDMKVLIVDDNRKVRGVIRDYLPDCCDEVFECSDGKKALEFYERHKPDWVLMDWEMPQLDGVSATRLLVSRYPQARICMVTAFDEDELKKEAFAAGACGFVLKDNLFELEDVLKI